MREEFTKTTKNSVERRAGVRCSNPQCRQSTSGPCRDNELAVNIGVAAHISAASPGGPRYNPQLSSRERRSPENAIWLCQNCAKLIDNDPDLFTEQRLRSWKARAEDVAAHEVSSIGRYREITEGELRQDLTSGERAAFLAFEEEFACPVKIDVVIPCEGGGWVRFDGAVIRGEDLVAVDIHEYDGRGVRYFQIEYLLELGAKIAFERFRRLVLYVAIISTAEPKSDAEVRDKLGLLAERAPIEVHIRMHRLNRLRAKYAL